MPRTSRKRRSPASFARKRKGSRKTRRVTKRRRSGTLGDIHSFKGIINAGILQAVPSGTSTILGGQYIFKLSDLPIIGTGADGGLGNSFDFVRLNKCRMEFMPRYNVSAAPRTTATDGAAQTQTFLTGLDEIPVVTTSAALGNAPTWTGEGDEDASVTEAVAFGHGSITPDYLRGMPNCKETEIYKKHVVHFTPVFYDYIVNQLPVAGMAPTASSGIFERRSKKWINLNFLSQSAGAEIQSLGPDFYGPMYCFGDNAVSDVPIQYYDVKLHYSVSFRRLRGI